MIYIHRRSPDINCCLALLARFSRFLSFLSVRVGKKKKKKFSGQVWVFYHSERQAREGFDCGECGYGSLTAAGPLLFSYRI